MKVPRSNHFAEGKDRTKTELFLPQRTQRSQHPPALPSARLPSAISAVNPPMSWFPNRGGAPQLFSLYGASRLKRNSVQPEVRCSHLPWRGGLRLGCLSLLKDRLLGLVWDSGPSVCTSSRAAVSTPRKGAARPRASIMSADCLADFEQNVFQRQWNVINA